VYGPNLLLAHLLRILECVLEDSLTSFTSDELDALYNTINHNMLDTGIFSFRILTNQNSIDIVVRCSVSNN
jgi:hypothetical protein